MKKESYKVILRVLNKDLKEMKKGSAADLDAAGDAEDVIYHTGYNDAAGMTLRAFTEIFNKNLDTPDGKKYIADYMSGIMDFYEEFKDAIDAAKLDTKNK